MPDEMQSPAASEARDAETCDLCGGTLTTGTDGHGLGECVETCTACVGAGCSTCGGRGTPTPAPAPGEAESEEMAALRKENEALRARLLIAEQLLAEERVTADALVSEADADAARERDVRRRTSKEYSGNLCAAFDKINALESQLAAATRERDELAQACEHFDRLYEELRDRELAAERALRDGVPSPVELETLRGFVGLVGAQTSERAAARVRVALRALDRLEKCRAALPPTPTPPEGTETGA